MSGLRASVLRLIVFVLIVALGTAFVVRALQRPAPGAQVAYTAIFTNASGLRSGDDVRLLGVQVGKVRTVGLQRGEGGRGALAKVDFTLADDQPVHANTTLAIRFQNLTGQRYIDLQRAAAPSGTVPPGSTIGTARTVPSFDITSVFNGLQPVLSTMRPADIDHFAQSVAAVVAGDGQGLGPLMDAIDRLSTFTDDRAVLFETLIRNVSDISEAIGGKSETVTRLLGILQRTAAMLAASAPQLRTLANQGAQIMSATDALLAGLGMTPDTNPWFDGLLAPEAAKLGPLLDLAALAPGLFAALSGQGVPPARGDTRCSQGVLALPGEVQLLIRGTRVVLCNPPK